MNYTHGRRLQLEDQRRGVSKRKRVLCGMLFTTLFSQRIRVLANHISGRTAARKFAGNRLVPGADEISSVGASIRHAHISLAGVLVAREHTVACRGPKQCDGFLL